MVQKSSLKQKLLIITGPTAVGKTKFSIECAKKFNGEIISADSIQIYKGLNIGSAKATEEEQSQAVHHLIDFVEPNAEFSVSEFQKLAREKIDEIASKGKLPIVVGGTGLFIKSLLFPFSFGGVNKNQEVRKKYEKYLEDNGVDALFELLEKVDKTSSLKIHKNNTKRVIRALEVFECSGKPISDLDEEKESVYDFLLLFLVRDRESLYENINKRVDLMMEAGLEEEVRELVKNYNLNVSHQSMQAIGYKEFFDYFENKCSKEDVVELIKKSSRHYAKRQFTWFNAADYATKVDCMQDNLPIVEKWLNDKL